MQCKISPHSWAPILLMPGRWASCKPCHPGLLCARCIGILKRRMLTCTAQDAVRGDHGEVAQLLMHHGGKIFKNSENRLVELNRSSLAGCAA